MLASHDEHPRMRIGLLDSDPIRVVGFAAEFENHTLLEIVPMDLATLVADLKLTFCIVGLHGNLDLPATLQTLRALRPGMRVMLMGPDLGDPEILRLVASGAKGYLHETATSEEIAQAIEAVRDGAVYVPKPVLSKMIGVAVEAVHVPAPAPNLHLTAREREVLELLVAAQSNREIARALGIEERTVKAHVAKLMRKVGVDNRIALSVFAVRHAIFATSGNLGRR